MASGAKPTPSGGLEGFLDSDLSAKVTRLVKVLQTTAGVDSTLFLTGYSLNAAAAVLEKVVALNLSRMADQLASTAAKQLRPGETIIATQQIPVGSPTARLADTAASFKAFAGAASEVRTFMRMWGVLKLFVAFKGVYKNPPADALLRYTTWAKMASILGYYVLEPYWYLSNKGVIRHQPPERTARAFRVACWAYIVYMFIDYVHLWKTAQLRNEHRRRLRAVEKEEKIRQQDEDDAWRASLTANLVYTPLTIHWAQPDGGFIPPFIVSSVGAIAGYSGFMQAWKAAGRS